MSDYNYTHNSQEFKYIKHFNGLHIGQQVHVDVKLCKYAIAFCVSAKMSIMPSNIIIHYFLTQTNTIRPIVHCFHYPFERNIWVKIPASIIKNIFNTAPISIYLLQIH